MASLYGYFDESGKSHDHDVVVFSGFVATHDAWEDLSDEWRRLLLQSNLSELHFKQQKHRTSLLKKFIRAIKLHIEFGISVAVKVSAFEALPEEIKIGIGGPKRDPHYLAFKMVLFAIVRKMIREPGSTINFVCDEDEGTTMFCYHSYKLIKRQFKDMREQLVSFSVADDKHFPQLQASDLMAALTRLKAESALLNKEDPALGLFDYLALQEENNRLAFISTHMEEQLLQQLAAGCNDVPDAMEEFEQDI